MWKRVAVIWTLVRSDARLLVRALKHSESPAWLKWGVAGVALYLISPIDLIPDFIKRRHGEVPVEYAHPLLESISKETYGVLIYQEQVMQATQLLAGYTLGAADLLRRAMGKKKIEEMQSQRATFVKGCKARNNIPESKANEVFDLLHSQVTGSNFLQKTCLF